MAQNPLKILIAGDSFAAQWPNEEFGWVNYMERKYHVTNIAQAGVSEYKILKQIESVNLNDFDLIIVSHTSPSRVHTPHHPLHKEGFHKDCDLIYTDLEPHSSYFNSSLNTAKGWFKYHYDETYQIDIYNLIRQQINSIINIPYISLTHIEIAANLAVEQDNINFSELWAEQRGNANHYTDIGNRVIFKMLTEKIKSKLKE